MVKLKVVILIVILVGLGVLTGSLQSQARPDFYTKELNGVQYFCETQLAHLGKYTCYWSYFKRKKVVSVGDDIFIFTLFSPYMKMNNEIFNLSFPVEYEDGKLWIPYESFLKAIQAHIMQATDEAPDAIQPEKPTVDQPTMRESPTDTTAEVEDTPDVGNNTVSALGPDSTTRLIIIDPGHGGKDPGAVFGKVYEKDIVLKVAKFLKDIFVENAPNWRILVTRDTDEFISLEDRAKLANEHKADLFISLHCNYFYDNNIRGSQCFYLSPAKNDNARATAALENSVLFLQDDPPVEDEEELEFILMDMLQNEYLKESSHLAVHVNKELETTLIVEKVRDVDCAGFYLLKDIYMPSVLVELGFLSNNKDRILLTDDKFQEKLASAIYKGIVVFFKNNLH